MDLMDLLKDKERIIKYIISTLQNADKINKGLLSMKERRFSDRGMLDKVVEVTAMQTKQIELLSIIALVYMGNSSFDRDVALILNRMEEEEIKTTFNKPLYNAYPYGRLMYRGVDGNTLITSSVGGAHLVFKSIELAEYAGNQFIDIYGKFIIGR